MRLPLITILISVSAFLMGSASHAQEDTSLNPERAFYKANIYYEAGDYGKAIAENNSILEKGLKSGNLYYNLGNAYFKNGELGRAILNYERARRFIPRDSDLLSNYRHARSLMKRADSPEKRLQVFRWLDRAMAYITLKQTVALAFLLYYLLVLYIILTKVFKRYQSFSTPFIAILSFFLILVCIPLAHRIGDLKRGTIIVSKITDARFEPLKGATVHFPLYEGMKVYVLRKKGDWYKIKRPDGKIGWITKNSAEFIGF